MVNPTQRREKARQLRAETAARKAAQAAEVEAQRLAILTEEEKEILRRAAQVQAKLAAWEARRQGGPLAVLDLTVRTAKALAEAGVTTREALAAMSDLDILKTPGLGKKALQEIRDALAGTP